MPTVRPGFNRRAFLRTATAGLAGASIVASPPAASARSASRRTRTAERRGFLRVRWLGTSGWRLDFAGTTVLVDPYLTRFATGLFDGTFNPATTLTVDAAVVDEHAGRPGVVLVTHSHWDHFNDVPYLAAATGARVVGTLTTVNLARSLGVKPAQLSPVKGGEVLDFGGFVVEVVASLHSRNANYSMAFPGVRLEPPPAPATIADLPEGDTLAFQVTVNGGPSVLFMGASDFVQRNLTGLTPDVAMIPVPSSRSTHQYVPRLLQALDQPRTVVPVHWDNFEVPLDDPPLPDPSAATAVASFARTVREVSPKTEVVIPDYLTPYTFT